MPDVVINRIIDLLLFRTATERQDAMLSGKRILSYEIGRLAVLYLALAAPNLLAKLDLWDIVLPPSSEVAAMFQQLPNLGSLTPTGVVSPAEDVTAFVTLAAHIPSSVATLTLRQFVKPMFTDQNVQALTDRIQQALTCLTSFTVHGCSMGLLARIVSVLPRTGMHMLDVDAVPKNGQDLAASMALALAWPTSVRAFKLNWYNDAEPFHPLPEFVARLPLAKNSLHVSTSELDWTIDMCQRLPLAPTLTHLWLTNLPPNLVALQLDMWYLTDDLAGFVWPGSLRHLDFKGNHLTNVPAATLPARLQTLRLKEMSDLSDDNAAEWVAALPTTLRMLDIFETSFSDNFAAALLQRMPAPRTMVTVLLVRETALSSEAKEMLATKFPVIDTFF
ncbi:hypothetical protein GGF32_006139 [Allomyces javanicus]|nr:hypothetical protein GGF32_006139 [Allomyces javanicus]